MPNNDKPIDWDGIEHDFRDGRMSNREIARWYHVSEGAIRKKAKAEGWVRLHQPPHVDRRKVEAEILPPQPTLKPEELPERARGIAGRLLDELDTMTTHLGDLEEMIETEESDPRRKQALLKALSVGERAMTLKNITAAMKTIAEAAAPAGKKAERQQAANEVSGRFGVRSAPRIAVDNTR